MGRLDETVSSTKMAKSSSAGAAKKSSKSDSKSGSGSMMSMVDMKNPKVQAAVLVGLLGVLALALWYGFTHGCLRRRRRHSRC